MRRAATRVLSCLDKILQLLFAYAVRKLITNYAQIFLRLRFWLSSDDLNTDEFLNCSCTCYQLISSPEISKAMSSVQSFALFRISVSQMRAVVTHTHIYVHKRDRLRTVPLPWHTPSQIHRNVKICINSTMIRRCNSWWSRQLFGRVKCAAFAHHERDQWPDTYFDWLTYFHTCVQSTELMRNRRLRLSIYANKKILYIRRTHWTLAAFAKSQGSTEKRRVIADQTKKGS